MISINTFLLVPAANFRDRGVSIPSICEADVADIVIRAMSEQLEEFGVHHMRYWDNVEAGFGDLAIEIGCLYDTRSKLHNSSEVVFGVGGSDLAELLGETLSEWGRCCSFGHQVKTPKGGGPSGRIKLSIFAINSTDSDQYLCRLTDLGRQLAQTIADYAKGSATGLSSALSSDSILDAIKHD